MTLPASIATSLSTSGSTPVRETPAPEPLHCDLEDGAHLAPLNEPVLDLDEIQGNILGGFNKDFQAFLFLEIIEKQQCRDWLRTQLPYVATSAEVLAFNRLFKALRHRRRHESAAVQATWMNVAFSYSAFVELQEVIPGLLDEDFADAPFRQGQTSRSGDLNDPPDSSEGWVIGNREGQPLILMQVASDTQEGLSREVTRIEDSIFLSKIVNGQHVGSGVQLVYKQNGANLPPPLAGHEHFGFLDGVSQPGLRGLLSASKNAQGQNIDVLTLRQNPDKRDQPPVKDPSGAVTTKGAPAQGKPGQDLLWPGEFVFGYPRQNPADNADWDGPNPDPGPIAEAGPKWGKNGSLLVFRRLRQDVGAFHSFLRDTATEHNVPSTADTSAAARVGSLLVGRWTSGAPVLRTSEKDLAELGSDDCANNDFEFQGATSPLPAPPPSDPFACTDDTFTQSAGDAAGQLCPFSGHIRKAYPRDDVPLPASAGYGTATGTALPGCPATSSLNESDTQTHRLLRRGIPYGEVSASTPLSPVEDDLDRGLLFFAYQTSIERQFEFVTRCWVNNPDFKEPGTGLDPILGQSNDPSNGRARTFKVPLPTAGIQTLTASQDWVIPTGGGYFFAPSLRALRLLANELTLTEATS